MFRWYRNAAKCYVYLSDISVTKNASWEEAFAKSRWFRRGWTLQELLAPKSVEFFSSEGLTLGDKRSLEGVINRITGIPIRALRGDVLETFSVADRMSWAANRQITRPEDESYCLLGIFGVHIPFIYGEERNAAVRINDPIEGRSNQSRICSRAEPSQSSHHPRAEPKQSERPSRANQYQIQRPSRAEPALVDHIQRPDASSNCNGPVMNGCKVEKTTDALKISREPLIKCKVCCWEYSGDKSRFPEPMYDNGRVSYGDILQRFHHTQDGKSEFRCGICCDGKMLGWFELKAHLKEDHAQTVRETKRAPYLVDSMKKSHEEEDSRPSGEQLGSAERPTRTGPWPPRARRHEAERQSPQGRRREGLRHETEGRQIPRSRH